LATFKSSSVNRLGYPRGAGVYPVKEVGVISIASNTTFASAGPDVIQVAYIPPNSFLSDYKFWFPVLDSSGAAGFKLVDTLTTVTTYVATTTIAVTGGLLSMESVTGGIGPTVAADIGKIGSQYGTTTRAIGSSGTQVVVWASGALLTFSCITSGTNSNGATASNIIYMLEWSPMYDGGV